jgi:hypothetical protein
MEGKCPFAIDVFKQWIIGYQKRELWLNTFMDGVQFEDIPIEVQMGIMNRFFIETYAGMDEYVKNCEPRYKKDMAESIEQLQSRLRPSTGMN